MIPEKHFLKKYSGSNEPNFLHNKKTDQLMIGFFFKSVRNLSSILC